MRLKLITLRVLANVAPPVALGDVVYKLAKLTWDGVSHTASPNFNNYIDRWQATHGDLLTLLQHWGADASTAIMTEFITLEGMLAIAVLITHVAHILRKRLEKSEKHTSGILPMDK
jgi:hypothetical protein